MKDRTRVNHPPRVELPPDNRPLVAPIYQNVKFEFESVEENERYFRGERPGFYYSRSTNPTVRQLELTLAELQGREDCLALGSGVAAISVALLTLLAAGDHVLCFAETYGPTVHAIRRILARFGVTHTMLSIEDEAGIESALAARPTKLVVFESPTNPVLKIADLARITAAARAHGALTAMDNTFAGFHNHGQYPVDLFLHSLTKYASGHGDVMGGAIIADRAILAKMRGDANVIGAALDPHAAFLIQRGLRTYFVRYDAQCRAALRIAEFLERHAAVEAVSYPGLPSHPRHALARAQMKDFGTIVSLELKGGADAAVRFVDALELFASVASLGSTESLVIPARLQSQHNLSAEERGWAALRPGTVRLSVGLEDIDDLIADLERGLVAAGGG
jgi:cystathionine beta-lyase/cystathionine gamma-synthase